ncbi:tudor/PWWP/MBT superfamily protein isoform 1 [Tanacetum coccineum]
MRSYRVGHFAESILFAYIENNIQCLHSGVSELGISVGIRSITDIELASNGKTPEKLKAVGSFLMKVFGVLFVRGLYTIGKRAKVCWSLLGTVNLCRSVMCTKSHTWHTPSASLESLFKLDRACVGSSSYLVVNADVNVTDLKAEAGIDVTDKNESLDATIEVNAAEYSSKPAVVTYTEPEVVEIDTGVPTVKVEPVSPPTTGDTGNLQEDQGLTDISLTDIGVPNSIVKAPSTGEPQTYVEHNVLHVELEGEGMDIDEVLRWKDEMPGPDRYLQVGEQKVDITHPRDIIHSLDNELFVSLQQLKSHPWWPGQIFDPLDALEQAVKHHKKDCFLVAYFGDQTFAWNESVVLKPFRSYFS